MIGMNVFDIFRGRVDLRITNGVGGGLNSMSALLFFYCRHLLAKEWSSVVIESAADGPAQQHALSGNSDKITMLYLGKQDYQYRV